MTSYDTIKQYLKNTKIMPKQVNNINSSFLSARKGQLLVIALVLVALASSATMPRFVQAVSCTSSSDCQRQIDSLNSQNTQAQQSLSALASQASSYQNAISVLQTEIGSLQVQIANNEAQQATLQQQIVDAQNKIDEQKKFLGEDLRAMYIDGQLSTIEELATSKNLSDYVDKEEYRTSVQNKIDALLKQIAVLQTQLEQQKARVDNLLTAEKSQSDQLAAAQTQQNQLLNYNQSQQDQFNNQVAANKSAIAELQREQYALNVRTFGLAQYGGTGGYPWANAVQVAGTYTWAINGGEYDPLGWGYRNCTSYAFWRLAQARGIMLPWSDFMTVYNSGGRIGYSIPDFRNLGYTVDSNPAGATLAVFGAGPYGSGNYGHIMYIESSTSSSAYVSQYNEAGDGLYSTMTIHPSSGVYFIHIP